MIQPTRRAVDIVVAKSAIVRSTFLKLANHQVQVLPQVSPVITLRAEPRAMSASVHDAIKAGLFKEIKNAYMRMIFDG